MADVLPNGFQNQTEAFVFRLCRRTFLSLWSYSNPRSYDNKELCDVLVVCEPDIVLISVKATSKATARASGVDLERWRRNILGKSTKQLYGGARALRRLDAVIRADGSLGIPLPHPQERRVHRIAVCIGSRLIDAKSGDFGKGFVHVFDEVTLSTLLGALDTVTDLFDYLSAREALHHSGYDSLLKGREEDLLAIYLHRGRNFPPEISTHVVPAGVWEAFSRNTYYKAKQRDDRVSYGWDKMIEYFVAHALRGTLEFGNDLNDNERIFRVLARESRFGRRVLASAFFEFWDLAKAGTICSRLCPSPQAGWPTCF